MPAKLGLRERGNPLIGGTWVGQGKVRWDAGVGFFPLKKDLRIWPGWTIRQRLETGEEVVVKR